jgi:hypothetical protein
MFFVEDDVDIDYYDIEALQREEIEASLWNPGTPLDVALSLLNRKGYRTGDKLYDSRTLSPGWMAIRKDILDRDGSICQRCGSEVQLHVHHINSVKEYPEDEFKEDNCIVLCKVCHKEEHQGGKKEC